MAEKMKLIRMFGEITRVEGVDSDSSIFVTGPCYKNATCGDGFDLPFEVMKRMAPGYQKFSNVREMHGKSAVGTSEIEIDDASQVIMMRAEIVDESAKKKVLAGVYKGFSVGVMPKKVQRVGKLNRVLEGEWFETSLVDRPADAESVFAIGRVDGAPESDEVEVEVEVMEDETTPKAEGETEETVERMVAVKDAEIEVLMRIAGEKDAEITRMAGEIETSGLEIARLAEVVTAKDSEIERMKAQIEELEKLPDPNQSKPMLLTATGVVHRIADLQQGQGLTSQEAAAKIDAISRAEYATDADRAEALKEITRLKGLV